MEATNAFNELNCQVTLRNVEAVCQVLALICVGKMLFFLLGGTIFPSEGTTQGDPNVCY